MDIRTLMRQEKKRRLELREKLKMNSTTDSRNDDKEVSHDRFKKQVTEKDINENSRNIIPISSNMCMDESVSELNGLPEGFFDKSESSHNIGSHEAVLVTDPDWVQAAWDIAEPQIIEEYSIEEYSIEEAEIPNDDNDDGKHETSSVSDSNMISTEHPKIKDSDDQSVFCGLSVTDEESIDIKHYYQSTGEETDQNAQFYNEFFDKDKIGEQSKGNATDKKKIAEAYDEFSLEIAKIEAQMNAEKFNSELKNVELEQSVNQIIINSVDNTLSKYKSILTQAENSKKKNKNDDIFADISVPEMNPSLYPLNTDDITSSDSDTSFDSNPTSNVDVFLSSLSWRNKQI